jgi:hypothetical protein
MIEKLRTKGSTKTEEEAQKTFWKSRPDGWDINRDTRQIFAIECKRVSDTSESYFEDSLSIAVAQHIPIILGLSSVAKEKGWSVTQISLITGHTSVNEKKWISTLKPCGLNTSDSKRIIDNLTTTSLLAESKQMLGRNVQVKTTPW